MAFVGTLDSMPVPDILQTLSLLRRSGKLTVQRGRDKVIVLLKDGNIVAAYHVAGHATLGEVLLRRELVRARDIAVALEVQATVSPPPLLGTVLVELNAIGPDTLQGVITELVEGVLGELVGWTSGEFRFDPQPQAETEALVREGRDLVLPVGIRTDQAILEAVTAMEQQAVAAGTGTGVAASPEPTMNELTGSEAPDGYEVLSEKHVLDGLLQTRHGQEYAARYGEIGRDTSLLRSIADRFRQATTVPENSLVIMQSASTVVRRGVLFAVKDRQLFGVGQFGVVIDGFPASDRVRNTKIPLDAPCVVSAVARYHRVFRGQLARTPWNDFLVRQLGGGQPAEAIAVPLVVDDRAILVLYGDNLPTANPIGSTMILELLMLYGAFALERCLVGGGAH